MTARKRGPLHPVGNGFEDVPLPYFTERQCANCGNVVTVMAFQGDRYCSIDCEKAAAAQDPDDAA